MKNVKYTPYMIFSIVGVLLIIISFLIAQIEPLSSTLNLLASLTKDIGIVCLTVVIINFFWKILGGDPIGHALNNLESKLQTLNSSIKILENSRRTGAVGIGAVSSNYMSDVDWIELVKSANEHLDLSGISLLKWTQRDGFDEIVTGLVKKGVKVRVLIMDEKNRNLSSIINETQISSLSLAAVKQQIKDSKAGFEAIENKFREGEYLGSFEFKSLKSGTILSRISRSDSVIVMVQYLSTYLSELSPIIKVSGKNSSLYKTYLTEFEKLWQSDELGNS